MDRREFSKKALVGIGALASCSAGAFAKEVLSSKGTKAVVRGNRLIEPSRELELDDWADIIVVGGGPAGIATAVTAARSGKKVRLFELQGSLGGVWTSGLLSYIFDFDKSETGREIMHRLDEYGARHLDVYTKENGGHYDEYGRDNDWVYEPEYMKFVCEDMCAEAGVKVLLQCPVVAAYRDGRNITAVVTESKSGRQAWTARTFVDCSGDGDLAALAGCGFDIGWSPQGWGQPATLNALVVVKDPDAIAQYVSNYPAMWIPEGPDNMLHHTYASHKLRDEMNRAGLSPSYGDPTLFGFGSNLFCFMVNHEYKLKIDSTRDITDATLHARKEICSLVRALESLGGPWEGMRVAATAEQIGHRDARRIHGRYTVTREDVTAGATFPDAVTTSRFGIDIHGMDLKSNNEKAAGQSMGVKFKPFQIPLRACRAKDVDNLYMAGRNISGDFIAHASYRVTGSSVAMGEGVGKAIAQIQ